VDKLKTRVFELYSEQYPNLSELARAMGICVSQVYRVRAGERHINEKFIIGATKAFPAKAERWKKTSLPFSVVMKPKPCSRASLFIFPFNPYLF